MCGNNREPPAKGRRKGPPPSCLRGNRLRKSIRYRRLSRLRIIPRSIIEKAPSAELKPDQKDQDALPPYEVLDEILRLYVEENLSARDIVNHGFDEKTVRWVQRRVDLNEYKREQAAPGLKVTSRAFGVGRRMPIAQKYVDLN
ncbi:MAG: hypothetical protein DME66_05025 [Verrucomicrobia bacterium]|nr:MAG: hypothetical protein DME66_05025 [Verrucomicrobiota bacterium]